MRAINKLAVLVALSVPACDAQQATDPPAAAVVPAFPDVLPLPDGFWPEGITFGPGTTFFVGSLATGAIYRGDARSGNGDLVVPAVAGREIVGLKYDAARNLLVAAGGYTGQAFLFDASSGAQLAAYPLRDPADTTLVNDVVLVGDVAYFTDSFQPLIYRLSLDIPGAVDTIPLTGDFAFSKDSPIGNANGIVATPGGEHLITVNMNDNALYLIDPRTGDTEAIDLGGQPVLGDGLLLVDHLLYVVEGPLNQVSVVRLTSDYRSGSIQRIITDEDLQFPSTIARFGSSLFAVNARFDVAYDPTVEYAVVRLPR